MEAQGGPGQVVDLAAAGGMGPDRVGSKAFNLARLAAAGLPVPAGFVVMPEAFQAWEAAGAMAVLVEVMVEAQAAGVAFTADPITGDHAEAVITAVRGLGERLVGGEATGDEWVVRAGQARCRRSAEDAIDAGQARQIARLARRAEAFFGAPQDVEWAIAARRVFLVPARPIAAPSDPVTWRPAGH